jgi:hypothetical protein
MNLTQIREVKRKLKENFDIKDLNFLKYFLDIKIAYPHDDFFSLTNEIHIRLVKRDKKTKL